MNLAPALDSTSLNFSSAVSTTRDWIGSSTTTSMEQPTPKRYFENCAPLLKSSDSTSEKLLVSTMRPILDRLAEFENLPANWNSYEAEPISRKAICEARDLLYRLQLIALENHPKAEFEEEIKIRPHCVAPLDDGGVQLEWVSETTDREIEVEIGPLGDLSYLFVESFQLQRVFHESESSDKTEVLNRIARVLFA